MLEAVNLSKIYRTPGPEIVIFDELSLAVSQGDLVAVTGPSGSGKSTLLHLLGGLDTPTKGSVSFRGQDIFLLDAVQLAEFRNLHVGFVFQFHHLLPEFTAVENTAMPLFVRGNDKELATTRAKELLDSVGLGARLEHKVGELSGGEQQRVAIARALIGRPEILLADEPTGNLDTGTAEEVFEVIRKLHLDCGLTSVIVTHNEKIANKCPQAWEIESGNLKEVSTKS